MKVSVLLSLLPLVSASPMAAKREEPAPLLVPRSSNLIADEYIVKFREGSALSILDEAMKKLPIQPQHKFQTLFKGFSGKLDAITLQILRNHPDVEYVEQNAQVYATGTVTQNNAPWGLGRISHRSKGSSQYVYDDAGGQGTCSYVVDTGIDSSHRDFEGRAQQIKSFVPGNTDDCGHGTHVAGTIGSRTYGVAKKTSLLGIKVLFDDGDPRGCTGSNSAIISGLDYVATDAATRNCPNGVVVNMSLGGSRNQALNDAARGLVNKGFFVAIAAGNENQDVSNVSPASESSACTVGGSDINDQKYRGSNYGTGVDIIGPAVDVLSTWPGGSTRRLTGTSMATPHIAGLAAYLASVEGVKASPRSCDRIQQLATKNVISGFNSNTVNLLGYNNIGA